MTNYKKFISVAFIILVLSSCGSSSKKEPCPTVEQEPVSTCRAIEKCQGERSSVGVGMGIGIGRNFGIGISQSQSTEAYSNCIDRELKDQEMKSKIDKEKVNSGTGQPGQKPGLIQ